MTDTTLADSEGATNPLLRLIGAMNAGFARIPGWIPQLVLRVTVAIPFWKSGVTKWDGFLQVSPSANYLFANEFKLHLFGAEIAYPAPALMAFSSGVGEILLPVMLVAGLSTRFAAFGLLIMTGIIQLTLPDAWQNFHLPWAAMLLPILVYGPGAVSIDRWLLRDRAGCTGRFRPQPASCRPRPAASRTSGRTSRPAPSAPHGCRVRRSAHRA